MIALRQWGKRQLRRFAHWTLVSDWAWTVPALVGCGIGVFIGRLL